MSISRRIVEVLYRTQSWTRFDRCWLLWSCVLRRHCFWETPIFIYCDGVFGWSSFLPRKGEVVDWIGHKSWVTNLKVVQPTCPVISSIVCIVSSWFSVMELASYDVRWNPFALHPPCASLGLLLLLYQKKNPETVSRTWVCTGSGKSSTENMRLLFRTGKIILSNKLSKR